MITIDLGGVPAVAPTRDFSDYLANEAARDRLTKELRPANKAALFDALAVAGIVSVVVAFDGCGDSGQIESVDARDAHGDVAIPETEVEFASPNYSDLDVETRALPVAGAIEQLAYDFLENTHGGWETSEGAYGEFRFDVTARTITLDYNERYVETETFEHEF